MYFLWQISNLQKKINWQPVLRIRIQKFRDISANWIRILKEQNIEQNQQKILPELFSKNLVSNLKGSVSDPFHFGQFDPDPLQWNGSGSG